MVGRAGIEPATRGLHYHTDFHQPPKFDVVVWTISSPTSKKVWACGV